MARSSAVTLRQIDDRIRMLCRCAEPEPEFPGAIFDDRILYDPRVDEAWELAA